MKKKLVLALIVSEIKAGLNPTKISRKYNAPKTTLSYSLAKLKKMGCIKKVGYGTWEYIKDVKEVPIRPKGSIPGHSYFSKKQIRGHAFIWKIEFIEPYHWFRVVKKYKKKKLNFSLICNEKVLRTILNSRKIWLTRRGLTIYEPLDFMGRSSFEVKGTAVYEMDRLIKALIKELGLKFRRYRFTTSREHYGMIKNELARQYNDKKEKLAVRGEDGTVWLWIDDSKGLTEMETNEPNVSRQVQKWYNDHKKHNFEVTPSMVLGAIKKNADNLNDYAKHLGAHVQSIKDLGSGVKTQNQLFERIANVLEKLEGGKK